MKDWTTLNGVFVKFKIELHNKDETIPSIIKTFYDALDPERAHERTVHFWETVGKLKGTNMVAESHMDFLLEELLWAAIKYGHDNHDKIDIIPIIEEEGIPKEQVNNTKPEPVFDPSVG